MKKVKARAKVKKIEIQQPVSFTSATTQTVDIQPASQDPVIPKILIGVPLLGWSHDFATSFLTFWTQLMTYKQKGRRFHVGYRFVYRKPVQMAEEELAQFAVDSGCTHLLLMDDDIYDVTADMLFALLDADKDVIGGIMHTGGFPYAMCAFRRYDRKTKVKEQPILKGPARLYEVPHDQRQGIQKVDLIPFAFTLIKTKIFKEIKKPWFECDNQAPTDSWFADRMLDQGYEYYAHFGVWLNHRGITRGNQPIYTQLGMYEQQTKNGDNIIMLTREEMKKHELMMIEKLETAEAIQKESAIKKQKWYDKDPKKAIATPIVEVKP